jgi:chromosome segregation ATPase
MKQKIDEVNTAHESTRLAKDVEIRQLHIQIETQRSQYDVRINTLNITIETLRAELLGARSKITSLEELLARKADVERQLEHAGVTDKAHCDAREQLRLQMGQATDYSIELEEKCYKAQRTSLELLKQLKDCEVEIETLKQYIIDLKQRIAVYIPVKEDAVDKRLAEYINNYPERSKLKIMFLREPEGVYQFGTKRVAVKVEKDSIKIRVGGGYLSIDEFLDQYTPVELEKLERKDPLKRFSEKVAI